MDDDTFEEEVKGVEFDILFTSLLLLIWVIILFSLFTLLKLTIVDGVWNWKK